MSDINSSSTKTSMVSTSENLLEYFNQYVKDFYPFRDEPVYKATIEHFINYYVDQLYNVQPNIFKTLFEDHEIPSEITDKLLVSIGMPTKLIDELTAPTKIIILKSFSDFQRYKASIKFVKALGGTFNDKISFYELFIDWSKTTENNPGKYTLIIQKNTLKDGSYFDLNSREKSYRIWFNLNNEKIPTSDNKILHEIVVTESDSSISIADKIRDFLTSSNDFFFNSYGQDILEIQQQFAGYAKDPNAGTTGWTLTVNNSGIENGAWVLKPRPIFVHPDMDEKTDDITYSEIYDSVASLLISEDQLTRLKKNEELILPIKSNLLLVDYSSSTDTSLFYTLLLTILSKEIAGEYINIYFSDQSFPVLVKTAVILWYYIVVKYYNVGLESLPLNFYTCFNQCDENSNSDYTLDDIETLENEYKKITNRDELNTFLNTRIRDVYGKYYENPSVITASVLESTLYAMHSELFEYINNRITNAQDTNAELFTIIDEIYSSFLIYFNSHTNLVVKKYSDIFLSYLPQISTDIETTNSYKILYNLKPYHTELINQVSSGLFIKDKFNSLLMYDDEMFLFKLIEASILNFSDYVNILFEPKTSSSLPFISTINNIDYLLNKKEELDLSEKIIFDEKTSQYSFNAINDNIQILNQTKIFMLNSLVSFIDSYEVQLSEKKRLFKDFISNIIPNYTDINLTADRLSDFISNSNKHDELNFKNLLSKIINELKQNYNINEEISHKLITNENQSDCQLNDQNNLLATYLNQNELLDKIKSIDVKQINNIEKIIFDYFSFVKSVLFLSPRYQLRDESEKNYFHNSTERSTPISVFDVNNNTTKSTDFSIQDSFTII